MSFSPECLLRTLQQLPPAGRYWVAFSGGCDSMVLLHAMVALRPEYAAELTAVHVNHGLQAAAGEWARRCEDICRAWGVPLERIDLQLAIAKGESGEAVARKARYGAIRKRMRAGDLLLTAHHQDDQAETVLLQLLRGSGPAGLAAMPTVTEFGPGWHARPLLCFSREELETYAQAQGLDWVEDTSNRDTRFDRNFLRHEVMPLLARRWPAMGKTLSRSAAHCAEAQELVEALAESDLATLGGPDADSLAVSGLAALPPARCRAALRKWIQHRGFALPDSVHLARVGEEVLGAAADRMPQVCWPGAEIRRYRDRLYLMAPLVPHDPASVFDWDASSVLQLPSGLGTLRVEPGPGGIDPARWAAAKIQVRFRRGGERCRPVGRGHRHALKNLFQEQGLPPWRRDRVPLIMLDDQLVAVGNLWICEPFQAREGQAGVRICWEP